MKKSVRSSERRSINVTQETWSRLQDLASGFAGDPLGTPEKVINHLLDEYEDSHLPPDEEVENGE